jgi:phosphopantothenoylcysteine decarboxylase/phosphopantothenate--cysteine ligase
MGGVNNEVVLITASNVEHWPRMSKADVAKQLAARITDWLSE